MNTSAVTNFFNRMSKSLLNAGYVWCLLSKVISESSLKWVQIYVTHQVIWPFSLLHLEIYWTPTWTLSISKGNSSAPYGDRMEYWTLFCLGCLLCGFISICRLSLVMAPETEQSNWMLPWYNGGGPLAGTKTTGISNITILYHHLPLLQSHDIHTTTDSMSKNQWNSWKPYQWYPPQTAQFYLGRSWPILIQCCPKFCKTDVGTVSLTIHVLAAATT